MRKLVLALAALLPFLTPAAQAQDFPSKPIKIVVPFPPGGSPDIIARILGEELQKKWKSPIYIENVAGAGGGIGAVNVAKSAPDGYTWLTAPNNVLIFNAVLGSANYDPIKDFTPVSMAISAPNIVVVASDFPPDDGAAGLPDRGFAVPGTTARQGSLRRSSQDVRP